MLFKYKLYPVTSLIKPSQSCPITFRVKFKCLLLGSKVLPTWCGSHPHFWLISNLSTLLPITPTFCPPFSLTFVQSQLTPLLGLCKSCAFCLNVSPLPRPTPQPPSQDSHINDFVSWSKTLLIAPLFSEKPSLVNKLQALPYYSWSIMLFSFLHSKYCYLMFSCLLLPGFDILHSLRAGTLSDFITVSPDTPRMLNKYLVNQWSLLLLGKLFLKFHSASLP